MTLRSSNPTGTPLFIDEVNMTELEVRIMVDSLNRYREAGLKKALTLTLGAGFDFPPCFTQVPKQERVKELAGRNVKSKGDKHKNKKYRWR